MYVSDLDRPWCETPFPIQGFYIRSLTDIQALESYCKFVYVDKAVDVGAVAVEHEAMPAQAGKVNIVRFRSAEKTDKQERIKVPPVQIRNPKRYPVVRPLKKSVSAAGKLLDQMHVSMARLYDRIGEGNKEIIAEAGDVARKMTQSVIENPDALIWMARVRQKSEHAWAHAMSSSIWGLVFARHLGLAPDV
ncbi:MAG: DUF3391 domain-containing protein, partial [Gammaproteobacteria bacterium]